MKALVIKLLLLGLPFAAIFFYCEHSLSKVPNSHTKKLAYLNRHDGEIELVVMGSSQLYDGIDPTCFTLKAFNLANVSQTIYYDTQLLNKFLPQMKSLKVAILGLSYFSFETDLLDSPEEFRCFFYRRFYGIPFPEPNHKPTLDPRNFSLVALYRSLHLTYKQSSSDLAPFQTPLGWNRLPGSSAVIDDTTGRETVVRHHKAMRNRHVASNLAYLEGTLNELKARQILTVIVTPPVHFTYSDHIDRLRYQFFLNIVKDICVRNGIVHLDYFFDERFTRDDFYDNDHLNMKGARKFSALLNDDINRLYPAVATGPSSPARPK